MTTTPQIILTSDDFGLSTIFNKKILEMLRKEYLTSTSVMVKRISRIQIKQVNELITIHSEKNISIGLHLELSQLELMTEVQIQFSLFKQIFGFVPEYIDIHKNSLFKEDYNILAKFCNVKHIAFRNYPLTTSIVASPNLSITATNLPIETLESMINRFENNKIYEIIFHVGTYDPNSKSKLNKERELDIIKLERVHKLINNKKLTLTNFKFVQ